MLFLRIGDITQAETSDSPMKNEKLRDCLQFLPAFQVKIGGDPKICSAFESKYSRMDQVKFVEDI